MRFYFYGLVAKRKDTEDKFQLLGPRLQGNDNNVCTCCSTLELAEHLKEMAQRNKPEFEIKIVSLVCEGTIVENY